jgi:RNA polymerase sigma-70 factor (ECF subfamily)
MLEDKLLIRQFKYGSEDAFHSIYEKHKNYMLTVATALLNDTDAAEDIVHSVFMDFAESIDEFELTGSLKRYLGICVANSARNANKSMARRKQRLEAATKRSKQVPSDVSEPERLAILSEEKRRICYALSRMPYDQREVVVLRLTGGMKFKEIAHLRNESINTIQSKYRYGLNKLRLLFDGEVTQ